MSEEANAGPDLISQIEVPSLHEVKQMAEACLSLLFDVLCLHAACDERGLRPDPVILLKLKVPLNTAGQIVTSLSGIDGTLFPML